MQINKINVEYRNYLTSKRCYDRRKSNSEFVVYEFVIIF